MDQTTAMEIIEITKTMVEQIWIALSLVGSVLLVSVGFIAKGMSEKGVKNGVEKALKSLDETKLLKNEIKELSESLEFHKQDAHKAKIIEIPLDYEIIGKMEAIVSGEIVHLFGYIDFARSKENPIHQYLYLPPELCPIRSIYQKMYNHYYVPYSIQLNDHGFMTISCDDSTINVKEDKGRFLDINLIYAKEQLK